MEASSAFASSCMVAQNQRLNMCLKMPVRNDVLPGVSASALELLGKGNLTLKT